MKSIPITVVIPCKNEEKNIGKCLSKLKQFSEVVLVDSGSTDNTITIAQRFGAKIVQFDWNGKFPKKRNWFLMNESIENEWVLFIDCDEYVTDAFCEEVSYAIRNTKNTGFWLNYTNFFMGKELKRGIKTQKLALFKFGGIFYEQISEDHWSALDMEVHEHPIIGGDVGVIKSEIKHEDYKDLSHYLMRHIDYAKWESKRYIELKNNFRNLTKRQRYKYSNLEKIWFPYAYFITNYFLKLGFLDGREGFYFSSYKFRYFRDIRMLIKESRR